MFLLVVQSLRRGQHARTRAPLYKFVIHNNRNRKETYTGKLCCVINFP